MIHISSILPCHYRAFFIALLLSFQHFDISLFLRYMQIPLFRAASDILREYYINYASTTPLRIIYHRLIAALYII